MKKMIATGTALTLGLALASTSASAATVDFKLGYSTSGIGTLDVDDIQDNMLISGSLADNNYFTANLGVGGNRVSIIRYEAVNDWANYIAANVLQPGEFIQVTSATLTLWQNDFGGTNQANIDLHKILPANVGWVTQEATWNSSSTGSPWAGSAGLQTAGTDYDSTVIDSVLVQNNGQANEKAPFTFDVSASVVQEWIDDASTNAGLLLRTNDSDVVQIYWSEAASGQGLAPLRPELFVDYEIVPEPASAALLGIAGGVLMLRRRAAR